MPATTPVFALPYPVPADPADVPADMQALANRIEAIVGAELAYAEITGGLAIPVGTEASPTTVVTAPAFTLPASTPIMVEFCAPAVQVGAGTTTFVLFNLWEAANMNRIAGVGNNAAATVQMPVFARRRLTASSGSHTYSIRATALTAAGQIQGSPVNYLPTYIRVSKA